MHLPDNHAMTMRACIFGITPAALHGIAYYGEDGFIEYPECIWVENGFHDNFVERLGELRQWRSDNCGFKELVFIDEISNLLDESYHDFYYINWMGPPAYLTQDELDTCMNEIVEKREKDVYIDRESFCESHKGKWSSEFNNCVGGSMGAPCKDVDLINSPTDLFTIITEDGECISHGAFCASMGGNSTYMSYEQMEHRRDIGIQVCEFED